MKNGEIDNTIEKESSEEEKIRYEQIICPKCLSHCKLTFRDYKINLSKCQCKIKHQLDNILLEEFEETQKILHNNYSDKNIITKNIINYKCEKHQEKFEELFCSYCKTCKKDLCIQCRSEHRNKFKDHIIISFGTLLPDKEILYKEFKKLKHAIDEAKKNIENIIQKLQKVKISLESLENLAKNIFKNLSKKRRNYKNIITLNKFKFDYVISDLCEINEEIDIKNKFEKIINLYDNIMFTDEINIIYNINEENIRNKEIKILGREFVENNKDKCKIIYKKQSYELNEKLKLIFDKNKNKNENILNIKLIGINKLSNLSNMFNNCYQLRNLPDISKINAINITDISNMFNRCTNLKYLPDLSRWNTCNIENISGLFKGCSSLKSLPDISKWNTSNFKYMDDVFNGCSKLTEISDISNWDTSNVISMRNLFNGCSSLRSLPNRSKWNIINVKEDAKYYCFNANIESIPNFEDGYEDE